MPSIRIRIVQFACLSRLEANRHLAQDGADEGRHSDIRLTMNVYTHTELADQTAAIAVLPGPPAGKLRVVAG